jgi:hypothetical protein
MTGTSTSAFLVEDLFRDNTTIQGHITWPDGERKKSFRSAVELVHLILAACDEAGPEVVYQLRAWDEADGSET